MRLKTALAAAFALLAAAPALAQSRSEVPLREVTLSDGTRRYAVTIKVGGTEIEAGLDSGSTGLRILPGTLQPADAKGTGDDTSIAYGAGTAFDGEVARGTLTIGGASGTTPLQLIKSKDCVNRQPNCPASKIPMEQFGIQGNGIPGAGFKAIFGTSLADNEVDNPLIAIGVKRWIITLPRSENETGRLVLNPSDEEVKDYVTLAIDGRRGNLHDAVQGCIVNQTTKLNACGLLTMDTGAPGIGVVNAGFGYSAMPPGAAAVLGFYDGRTPRAMESFTVNSRDHAARLDFFPDNRVRGTVIRSGLAPYFAFEVLYDPGKRVLGLKARPATGNSPVGAVSPN